MTQFGSTPPPTSSTGYGPTTGHEATTPSGSFAAGSPGTPGGSGDTATKDVAKDQAGAVAGSATDAGKHVAGVAGEQAGAVKQEATQQAKDLLHQTRGELTEQAATQQKRAASGLHSLAKELGSMADTSEQPGMATDLARQAADRSRAVASWLDAREPGNVVDEVTRFARQRPGAFLAIAAGAGLLVGRLGRGLQAAGSDDSTDARRTPAPALHAPVPRPSAVADDLDPLTAAALTPRSADVGLGTGLRDTP